MGLISDDGDENELLESPEDEDLLEGQEAADDSEDTEEAETPAKPSRAQRRKDRAAEHAALVEARSRADRADAEARNLRETIKELSTRMAESTASLARTAEGMGKPAPKPLEQRISERLQVAAARVRPASEDNGESARAYFAEQAAIIKEAAQEQAREIARSEVGEFARRQPAQPQEVPPDMVRHVITAPWMKDPHSNEGVKRVYAQLAQKRNVDDPNVFHATLHEAIVKYGTAMGLPLNIPNGAGPRQTPAMGAGGRAGGLTGGGTSSSATPVLTETMKRLADEHKVYRKLPAAVRYKRFYNEIVKPEME